jgi:hypothetical protein
MAFTSQHEQIGTDAVTVATGRILDAVPQHATKLNLGQRQSPVMFPEHPKLFG